MNVVQKVAHGVVSSVANDLRDNTLTNAVGVAGGAVAGGAKAAKAAKSGFTMLPRHVGRNAAAGAVKGGATGLVGSTVVTVTNKIASVEKWFDNTKVGKAIDDGITNAENWAHKAIGGGSY